MCRAGYWQLAGLNGGVMSWLLCHAGPKGRRATAMIELLAFPLAILGLEDMLTPSAKQIFGTDGIRGIPGEYPLDDTTLERVGSALGLHLSADQNVASRPVRVLIGRDTRESGPHIAELIAGGLASTG